MYGFTGATIGQLPCLEISSSVTSYGKFTMVIHGVETCVHSLTYYCQLVLFHVLFPSYFLCAASAETFCSYHNLLSIYFHGECWVEFSSWMSRVM